MIASRCSVLLMAAVVGCAALHSPHARAQWWPHSPADFEECADAAEKASTKDTKASALAECNAKFAGRRKPGGGYTYYDFMQNRSFDIAGPNPTPEEQRKIDQQYTEFLDQERRDSIAAKQQLEQQQQQAQPVQPVTFHAETEKIPLPVEAPNRQPPVASADVRAHAKFGHCRRHSFSCEWPRLSEGIKDLKKMLFGSSGNKAKRS